MPPRLARRWEWQGGDDGYVSVAEAHGGLLLAFSPNSGVVALHVQGTAVAPVWRYPDPAADSIDLVGALGGAGGARLFVAFQQVWSAPALHAVSAVDGAPFWQRALGQGIVYSAAADARLLYVHHGFSAGHRLRVFDGATGTEIASVAVTGSMTPLVAPAAPEGRVLYGVGQSVVEYDATTDATMVLATQVLREAGGQQLGSLAAAGRRVYTTDGSATVTAIDRAPGVGVLWRQVLPGEPDLGEPIYDAGLDAVLACGLNGHMFCLDAGDGAVRWVARCERPGSSQTVGVPAVVSGLAGGFVVFPGVDEALYLADGASGQVLDRVPFEWPLEVALLSRSTEVLVPHPLGVTAFELTE